MVDVSAKPATTREATATGFIRMAPETLALAIGGIYWSGHGTLGTGLFHPLVIGWLVCLIGLAGLSYAAYLLLVDLGYIEPLHEGQD